MGYTLPRDVGVDSGGNYRNIARNQVSFLSTLGELRFISWRNICLDLYSSVQAKESCGIELNLAETAIVSPENGQPQAFLCTDCKTGRIVKPRESVDGDLNHFIQRLADSGRALPYAAVVVYEDGALRLLDQAELVQLGKKGTLPPGTQTVSAFILPKELNAGAKDAIPDLPSTAYSTFRHVWRLDNQRAWPHEQYVRLNVDAGVIGTVGNDERCTIPLKAKPINDTMSRCVRNVVSVLEIKNKCRVIHMISDFVLDARDDLWLVCISKCQVAEEFRLGRSLPCTSGNGRGDLYKRRCKHKQSKLDQEQSAATDDANLSSTKLEKFCKGDFCDFDIKVYTCPESDLNDVCDPTIERFAKQSVTKTTKVIEQEAAETFKAMKGVDRIRGDVDTAKLAENHQDLQYELPYNIIFQARKEKYLVDVLLRRYKQGHQKPEYLSCQGDEGHLVISEDFPGHHYKSVRVCQTCYLIYNLIHEARAGSMRKMSSLRPENKEKEGHVVTRGLEVIKDPRSVLARSLVALRCVTKGDISEIRSFSKPPAAVLMVVSALFVLLRGEPYEWDAARPALSFGDQIFQEMSVLTPQMIRRSQIDELERYIRNPMFRPEKMLPASKAAAKICAWLLGMVNGFKWQNGWFIHGRLDPLINFSAFAVAARIKVEFAGDQEMMWNQEMESRMMRSTARPRGEPDGCVTASATVHTEGREATKPRVLHGRESKHRPVLCQQTSVDRLNARKDVRSEREPMSISRFFTSSDGVTRVPYEILSSPGINDTSDSTACFVVCQDIFDTLDMTKLLFYKVVRDHPGCQVLLYNYPGQAGTAFPRFTMRNPDNSSQLRNDHVLNNEFMASLLNELLQHVSSKEEFLLINRPVYLVGFGIGVSVAVSFAHMFGKRAGLMGSLKAIVSVNGCVHVDTHLASVLHSSINLFRSLPESRPDLPVSFFTRFLFSDRYIESVTLNLALNMYTAVMNPITLEGRIRLCSGALKNRDLRKEIQDLDLPLIALQSTDNFFIQPSNVDILMEQREVSHIWSQDLLLDADANDSCYSTSALSSISLTLLRKRGGLIVFVRSGHAVAQECKRALTNLFSCLAGVRKHEYDGPAQEMSEGSDATEGVEFAVNRDVPHRADGGTEIRGNGRTQNKGVERLGESQDQADLLGTAFSGVGDILNVSSCGELVNVQHSKRESECVGQGQGLSKAELGHCIEERESGEIYQKDQVQLNVLEESPPLQEEGLESASDDFLNYADSPDSSIVGLDENDRIVSNSWKGIPAADLFEEVNLVAEQPNDESPAAVKSSLSFEFSWDIDRSEIHRSQPRHSTDVGSNVGGDEILTERAPVNEVFVRHGKLDTRSLGGVHAEPSQVINSMNSSVDTDALPFDNHQVVSLVADSSCLNNNELHDQVKQDAAFSSSRRPRSRGKHSRSKLGDALKLYLETGLPWELFSLEHSVETRKELPLCATDDGNEVELRYVPPTADEILLRAARELEEERKREQLIIDKVKRDREPESSLEQLKKEHQRRRQFYRVEDDALLNEWDEGISNHKRKPLRVGVMQEMVPKDCANRPEKKDRGRRLCADHNSVSTKLSLLDMQQFGQVEQRMAEQQENRDAKIRQLRDCDRIRVQGEMVSKIQTIIRCHLGRRKGDELKKSQERLNLMVQLSGILQRYARGRASRRAVNEMMKYEILRLVKEQSTLNIQRMWRGHKGRRGLVLFKQAKSAVAIQTLFRAILCRTIANKERAIVTLTRKRWDAAINIQNQRRKMIAGKRSRELLSARAASTAVQRVMRGYFDRRKAARMKKWERTEPGPDRVTLGLEMIEEVRKVYDRQRQELDFIHSAQEKAEAQFIHVIEGLKQSEKELHVLEREMSNLEGAGEAQIQEKSNKRAWSQVKKESQEKKRLHLEAELSLIFADVEKKRDALKNLELSIARIEGARGRKERELNRVQQNLIELLHEQKAELDQLRERGIELETATATSAAAAEATAMKAREHEKQSAAMFSQQEELLKFQFMNMSLSYFSSLKMLKEMRKMNTDTTVAAIASSADTAAVAAAAASAANVPTYRQTHNPVNDPIRGLARAPTEVQSVVKFAQNVENIAIENTKSALPKDCHKWTIADVSRWLQSLSLGMYVRVGKPCWQLGLWETWAYDTIVATSAPYMEFPFYRYIIGQAFEEACVDGEFLLDLREEDMASVLGVEHKLHRRKLILARDKLKSPTDEEVTKTKFIQEESRADGTRSKALLPDARLVFSQARHGRLASLEESLESGFDINAKDEYGNTLLMVAVQNRQRNMVDFLMRRGSRINEVNSNGNAALHYALAYDPTGQLAEFLIERGADDTLENKLGLTPYDGIGEEENTPL